MNKFNEAAKYVGLLLLVELALYAVMIVSLFIPSLATSLSQSSLIGMGISLAANLGYLYSLFRLYKAFGDNFKKAYIYLLIVILISIVVYAAASMLNDETVLLIIMMVYMVMRMLCFYFLLTGLHDIAGEMKNQYLTRQLKICRSAYMVALILNAGTLGNLFGETIVYIIDMAYSFVTVYILLLYNRLRLSMSTYKEPEQQALDDNNENT